MTSTNCLLYAADSPTPRDSQIPAMYDEEKLHILPFEKLEPAYFWLFFCLKNELPSQKSIAVDSFSVDRLFELWICL